MKKIVSSCFKIGILLILLVVCVAPGLAQEKKTSSITVVGTGGTKEAAIQDALRTAVERAMGVYIYSSTEVADFQVIKDKIIASSTGYVNNYQVVRETHQDDIYFLTLNVDVNTRSIDTIVRKDIQVTTFSDTLKDYALVTQRMDKLRKARELVKQINDVPVSEKYSADLVGYKITDVSIYGVAIEFAVRLSMNPFYWNTYYDLLKHLAEDCKNKGVKEEPVKFKYGKRVPYLDHCKKKGCLFHYEKLSDTSVTDNKKLCFHEDVAEMIHGNGFQIEGYFQEKRLKEAFKINSEKSLNYNFSEYLERSSFVPRFCYLNKLAGDLLLKVDKNGYIIESTSVGTLRGSQGVLIPSTGVMATMKYFFLDAEVIKHIKNLKFRLEKRE